jgi:DNA primase
VRLTKSQRDYLELAVSSYQKHLHLAEEYLTSRGISEQVANTFRLGVVAEPLIGHEQYRGRLAIPYLSPTGVTDIRFRSLDNSEPKYLGLAGAKTHLFNASTVLSADNFIAVTEGEIDTMTLTACGIPAVGVPGVNNWKPHYNRILQDFEVVYVFGDGDQAGQDFARVLAKEISGAHVISMEDGEDVNSLYVKYGSGFIREKIGLKP